MNARDKANWASFLAAALPFCYEVHFKFVSITHHLEKKIISITLLQWLTIKKVIEPDSISLYQCSLLHFSYFSFPRDYLYMFKQFEYKGNNRNRPIHIQL